MAKSITLGDAVNQLEASLSKIQAHLDPLLSAPLNETIGKLPVMDRCKLEVMVAYAINTLFWIYLKTQGVPPNDHPVMKELERIRGYIQKIKETEGTHKRK
ncbi:exosome-associated factor Rrp47/DNA strand repair C1D [Basidiobolus meristosporus CBS 931.73]|uniref:Exosome complex protein n=1 Tax=Basidiobolus meristosporus CBS 931.73 TaxID=1314790 RepID=A0A1Y1XTW2_9FUNG|nr:exosome-associated factor Rrp47/DNA strand repair C1D [Basidiobolus meristosporus CBS 931.73]|eukprot:ORX89180.1 exosome-associated factor Rrp47/DNA strand repair C1D [Basidiobolus meristosporus CBS 931.73]